jgi:hypothetical protein
MMMSVQWSQIRCNCWLGTYIGKIVSSGCVFVGSGCVIYEEDIVPSRDDVKLMGIITFTCVVEENARRPSRH